MSGVLVSLVTHDDLVSKVIRAQAGTSMPFIPSHAEAKSLDGKTYIGAFGFGGVLERPIDYDADRKPYVLPSGKSARITVELPTTQEQTIEFYEFLRSKIGQPYDWLGIAGEALTELHLHTPNHVLCSALMVAGLRHINFFKWPLTKPFHKITPDALLLMLSSHMEIDH